MTVAIDGGDLAIKELVELHASAQHISILTMSQVMTSTHGCHESGRSMIISGEPDAMIHSLVIKPRTVMVSPTAKLEASSMQNFIAPTGTVDVICAL